MQRHTAYHCTVSHNCSCFSTCIEVTKPAVFEFSKKQPLAATRVAASGRKWPQVAASGRKWPQVAARGRTWPVALLVGFEISRAASRAATCIIRSHLQPLAATRVAASGRKWPQVAASGRKWPQVAAGASGRKWLLGRQIPARMAPALKT